MSPTRGFVLFAPAAAAEPVRMVPADVDPEERVSARPTVLAARRRGEESEWLEVAHRYDDDHVLAIVYVTGPVTGLAHRHARRDGSGAWHVELREGER